MNDQEVVVASSRAVPAFSLNTPIVEAKEKALAASALIARVNGLDSKILAVRAQKELKTIVATVEKARVGAKEPLLAAGRQLDNICKEFVLDLEKEFGRVSECVRLFDDAERRRVQEEERLQQAELARIQREKDAEIERLLKEQEAKEAEARRLQEEIEQKARMEAAKAEALVREANTAKERQAAKAASEQAERDLSAAREQKQRAEAAMSAQRVELGQMTAQIEEKASDAAYVAGRPVEITRVQGQITRPTWEVTSIDIWKLSKARPDLVTDIIFDKRAITAALGRGEKLAGVTAREVYKADVRAGKLAATVDV